MLLAAACGDGSGPGDRAAARIDFVDGAIEPILAPGQSVIIEGFGFGDAPGTVTLRSAAGAAVPALVDSAAWLPLAVRFQVPAGASAGPLTLTTRGGRRLSVPVRVIPAPPFDTATLAWLARPAFPRAPIGVSLAAAEVPQAAGWRVAIYAAGGAEPVAGDSAFDPDSSVYLAIADAQDVLGPWVKQPAPLPAPRAFAAAAIATRFNSRTPGMELYVIGGIDTAGRALASVLAADVTIDGTASAFVSIEPLPAPVAGASAVVRRGRLYVMGGTDSTGRPQRSVYVGRVGLDGHIDGWFVQPQLSSPRAWGGAVVLDGRAFTFGGLADSTGPGGELDATPPRLATADTAPVSAISGFFTGNWASATNVLPAGRSQFATLDLGDVVLVIGGLYSGAAAGTAEVLAARIEGDSLGPFAGPVGNSIAGLGGGILVGPAGINWRGADGKRHGVVIGGFDLTTRLRRTGAWGF